MRELRWPGGQCRGGVGWRCVIWAVSAATLVGCGGGGTAAPRSDEHDAAAAPTNRVEINAAVRQNLGITFARVERRSVARTLRVPGRFELLPTAAREYRSAVSGRVEVLVSQYQEVEEGTPLYRIDSPQWRELQRELADAEAALGRAQAAVDSIGPFKDAHERHHAALESVVDLWQQRVESLEGLLEQGGVGGEEVAAARAQLAAARSDLAETFEKEAELEAREREAAAELEAARARRSILLEGAAVLTGLPVEALQEEIGDRARWATIGAIEVRALSAGVVDSLTAISGSFVEEHGAVLSTVLPQRVRFRAHGLQSDIGKLADGQAATIVPPQGGSLGGAAPVQGVLKLAPTAEAERRTIELTVTPDERAALPDWARAGVSGFVEIVVAGGGGEELAIPLACVARDGTETIIFRRDPRDGDKAIRMPADLGVSDGRWVEIRSGVAEGDEIVLDGVYQLMVATSGSITRGGHFHADGTFHEGED